MSLNTQIEQLHKDKNSLSSELRDRKNEIETLNKRLDISQKLNEELKQKIESEKQAAATLHNADLQASQKELQKAKAQAKATLDNVYSQLEEVKNSRDQSEMTIKMVNNKVERILENASHYFETEFPSAENLISFLSQPPPQKSQYPQQQPNQCQPQLPPPPAVACTEQIQASLEKKLRHERARSKALSTAKEELESTVEKLKREIQEIKLQNQQEINNLNNKTKQMIEDQALIDAEKKHTIAKLQAKVDALSNKLIMKRKESNARQANTAQRETKTYKQEMAHPTQTAVSTTFGISSSSSDDKVEQRNCAASELLASQNAELQAKLCSQKQRCDELQGQLQKSQQHCNDLDLALSRAKNDFSALSIVHQDTMSELEMMRKALHEKESVKDRADKKLMRREFQAQKALAQNLAAQVDSQKEQLNEISLANQQALHTIDTQHTTILDLKQEIAQSNDTIQKLRDELISTQAELDNKQEITPDQLIPSSAWSCSAFSSELNTSINMIARNPSLQVSSKIQNVYKIIAKYYDDIIAERDATIESAYNENQKASNAINQFLINLSIALELEPITFNDFMVKHSETKVIDTIKEIRTCHTDLKRKNEQLLQGIDVVNRAFNICALNNDGTCNISEIETQINCFKCQHSTAADQLAKRTKKYRELASALKAHKKKAGTEAEDANALIRRLKSQVEDLQKQNEELSQGSQKMKWELQTAKAKLTDQQQAHEEITEELKERIETLEKDAAYEKAKAEAEYNAHIQTATVQNVNNSDAISQYVDQISMLKKSLEMQKATIKEKEGEITRLAVGNENIQHDDEAKYASERKQLVSGYEKAVAELRAQCEAHRADVEKMAKALAATEKKLKQAKESILQLKKDKLKSDNDFKSQQEQYERQKKLAETASKVAILNAQTDFNSKLDEERAKIEEERRRLYNTIADSFKQFTVTHETLNEKSFKQTIFKARDEISRLTAMDAAVRRIVNADRYQKTDDAVAQAVLKIA
ncbi:hypothetical protein TRFO_19491 [Tritrichomonas foetus]|uniref:Uncharacterized protein n=1 Tax=Tritrichomonas foetus TaxID=1144522 RepID=A0A1J4KMR7_9EUKA|nr:hypothetical protein [Tritrichomonas foetus]OHT10998.1 hypothetical protein TRFO_19491 [Tritrichomonas foetus]|eukprot:OHT10998.1 hypothetical protein TRFO_19491 [Tritrichomonas foetus]